MHFVCDSLIIITHLITICNFYTNLFYANTYEVFPLFVMINILNRSYNI